MPVANLREGAAQPIAGAYDQIVVVVGQGGGERSGNGERVDGGRRELHDVAELRKHRQRFDQVIAVGAPAGHVQSEVVSWPARGP